MVRYYNFKCLLRSSLMAYCFTSVTPLSFASTQTADDRPWYQRAGSAVWDTAANAACWTRDVVGVPCPPEPTASVTTTTTVSSTPVVETPVTPVVAARATQTTPRVDPVVETPVVAQSQPATRATSSAPIIPPPDSGITLSPEGYMYTRDGQIVMTGFEPNRKPLEYEEGMKITYDDSGRATSVEQGNMCRLADFQDPSTTGLPGVPASTTTSAVAPDRTATLVNEDPGTTEPAANQDIIDAAKNFRGLPADATVEQIRIYNENLPIPGRPIDSACGTDFIGPMAPNTFCGPNASGLAAARTPEPSAAASTTTSDNGSTTEDEPVVGSPQDVIVVTAPREPSEGSTAPESGVISPIPDLDSQVLVTPGDVDAEEALSNAQAAITSSAPVPASANSSVESTPDYLDVATGTDPEDELTSDDIVLTGSGTGFYSGPASQRTTEDDVINDREQQSLASQPTTTEFTDAFADVERQSVEGTGSTTTDRMSDSDSDDEVVIVPTSTTTAGGSPTPVTTTGSQPVAPAGGFRVSELERSVLVARQTLNAVPVTAETVLDDEGNKRVVHTLSDGAVVMGTRLNVVTDDKAVQNRANLLRQGISEDTLKYCDDNFGTDYENCLKFVYENMHKFDEDLVRTNLENP